MTAGPQRIACMLENLHDTINAANRATEDVTMAYKYLVDAAGEWSVYVDQEITFAREEVARLKAELARIKEEAAAL